MFIYNITFHIDRTVHGEGITYLKEVFIPGAVAGGMLHKPCIRKVLFTQDDSSESYAVQFHLADMDTLNDWMERGGEAIHRALSEKFGDKMLGFPTLLEEIGLE